MTLGELIVLGVAILGALSAVLALLLCVASWWYDDRLRRQQALAASRLQQLETAYRMPAARVQHGAATALFDPSQHEELLAEFRRTGRWPS